MLYTSQGSESRSIVAAAQAAAIAAVTPNIIETGIPTTVTITGSNFTPGSVARVNGTNLSTSFVSFSQITAVIPGSVVPTEATYNVDVVTTGLVSNVVSLSVDDDLYFANLVAALHFDGTDTSTVFTDVIGSTWTAAGNAQIDTAIKKYGTGSGLFDGTTDVVSTPDQAGFVLGTGDFTVELWVYPTAATTGEILAHRHSSDNNNFWAIRFNNTRNIRVFNKVAGVQVPDFTSSGLLTLNTWNHLALVRTGTSWRLYLNGVRDGTGASAVAVGKPTSRPFLIGMGDDSGSGGFIGQIDDFRLYKGRAKYPDATFVPLSNAFPNS